MASGTKRARSLPLRHAANDVAATSTETSTATYSAAWFNAMREDAHLRAHEYGWPTRRVEEWKYTNLRPLAALDLAPAPADLPGGPLPRFAIDTGDAYRLVFVNGRFRPELSALDGLPKGVSLGGFDAVIGAAPDWVEANLGKVAAAHPFEAMNTAFMTDGCVLHLPAGAVLDKPIHLAFVSEATDQPIALHPRILLVADAGARAAVIESHQGSGQYFSNPLTEVRLAEGATITQCKLQAESTDAYHIALTEAALAENARYESVVLSLGAALSRNESRVRLEGSGGNCWLGGGYLMRGTQHVDNTTHVEHIASDCTSRQVFKGALDDSARGVFQGKIMVRRDAQKTDGHQLNRTILLSDRAEIDTKPELEIYADDVKCSHGATAGELDAEQMFYLRARGIGAARARSLLIEGFMAEIFENIADEKHRDAFQRLVADWLGARDEADA